jgi:hypothetical protein
LLAAELFGGDGDLYHKYKRPGAGHQRAV